MRALVLALVAFTLAACGAGSSDRTTVLAASNVAELVELVAERADVAVAVSAAGTPTLAAQVRANGTEGLDLLLLADEDAARDLAATVDGVPDPEPLASTILVAVVGAGVRATSTPPIEDPDLTWALAERGVPLGDATAAALGPAAYDALLPRVVTLEPSALDVLAKVEAGAVDAAVVYRSNAITALGRATIRVAGEFSRPSVTMWLQPLTQRGRELADILRADTDTLRELGYVPAE